eukprot:IDg2771t1
MAKVVDKPFLRDDGCVNDGTGQVFDSPDQFVGLKITHLRSVDLVAGCPVFIFLYGLKKELCRIYATPHGDLPGGVHFPLNAVGTWEWQRRICVPNRFIQQGRHADENLSRAAFLRGFVTRIR